MGKVNLREFFVGYLPMPAGLNKFYKWLIIALVAIVAAIAFWMSSAQKSVGTGTWSNLEPTTFEGMLKFEPYPVLHVSKPQPVSVLLVQRGKFSAETLAAEFKNKQVAVTGFPIQRGDWVMLEIADASAFSLLNEVAEKIPEPVASFGRVNLRGEIVDSKCFLGVMKPGAGKVHRACAALCLKGGIPPVLVTKSAESGYHGYLLTKFDGSSAAAALAALASVPVEISGELEQRGGLLYIRMQEQLPRQLGDRELIDFGQTLAMANLEKYELEEHRQCMH